MNIQSLPVSNMVWEISCPTSVWDNTNHDLHLFLLLPFIRSCMCAHIFRFLHFFVFHIFSNSNFFVHRNAGDPVVKFSPRLHMVSSTFCIQFQIHPNSFNSVLVHIYLCNLTISYKISITCRFWQMKGLQCSLTFQITKHYQSNYTTDPGVDCFNAYSAYFAKFAYFAYSALHQHLIVS